MRPAVVLFEYTGLGFKIPLQNKTGEWNGVTLYALQILLIVQKANNEHSGYIQCPLLFSLGRRDLKTECLTSV